MMFDDSVFDIPRCDKTMAYSVAGRVVLWFSYSLLLSV